MALSSSWRLPHSAYSLPYPIANNQAYTVEHIQKGPSLLDPSPACAAVTCLCVKRYPTQLPNIGLVRVGRTLRVRRSIAARPESAPYHKHSHAAEVPRRQRARRPLSQSAMPRQRGSAAVRNRQNEITVRTKYPPFSCSLWQNTFPTPALTRKPAFYNGSAGPGCSRAAWASKYSGDFSRKPQVP